LTCHHCLAHRYCRLLKDFARIPYENAKRIELSSASFIVGFVKKGCVFRTHWSAKIKKSSIARIFYLSGAGKDVLYNRLIDDPSAQPINKREKKLKFKIQFPPLFLHRLRQLKAG
jgi:hypothetical protein